MDNIVDLTAIGPDLPALTRAANNAKAQGGVDGFNLTTEQTALMTVLVQGGRNIKRKDFMGKPITEVE